MPIGDGFDSLVADCDAFQLCQRYAEFASLPFDLHKDFGGIVPAFIKHSNHFDLISLFNGDTSRPLTQQARKGNPSFSSR